MSGLISAGAWFGADSASPGRSPGAAQFSLSQTVSPLPGTLRWKLPTGGYAELQRFETLCEKGIGSSNNLKNCGIRNLLETHRIVSVLGL